MNIRKSVRWLGMDALLTLIILLVGFAFVIFLINRSVRSIMIAGCVLGTYFALKAFGVLG